MTREADADARRYRVDLEYDGGGFYGWQAQPDERTVQGTLEEALERLTGSRPRVTGAGRTDRGCHATQQVAHFDLALGGTHLDGPALRRAVLALMPPDIRVRRLAPVSADFHARFGAVARRYVYLVVGRPTVFWNRYAWARQGRLDLDRLRSASSILVGEHDFRPFSVREREADTTLCNVHWIRWSTTRWGYRFSIQADRFVRRMVRMLVGALVPIGAGERPVVALAEQLDGRVDPRPVPAPAQGLYLAGVRYDRGERVRAEGGTANKRAEGRR